MEPAARNPSRHSAGNTASRTFERMTTEPVVKLVLRLGIPTVLSMLVTALYNPKLG